MGTRAFQTFGCWHGLLQYLESSTVLYYHAPLDTVPSLVCVVRKFKNGKLRLASGPYGFTADPSHLDRFRYLA